MQVSFLQINWDYKIFYYASIVRKRRLRDLFKNDAYCDISFWKILFFGTRTNSMINLQVDTFEYRLLRETEFRESITRRFVGESDVQISTVVDRNLGPVAPPQITQKPRNSKLVEGSDAVFTAKISGNPKPRVSKPIFWFLNFSFFSVTFQIFFVYFSLFFFRREKNWNIFLEKVGNKLVKLKLSTNNWI